MKKKLKQWVSYLPIQMPVDKYPQLALYSAIYLTNPLIVKLPGDHIVRYHDPVVLSQAGSEVCHVMGEHKEVKQGEYDIEAVDGLPGDLPIKKLIDAAMEYPNTRIHIRSKKGLHYPGHLYTRRDLLYVNKQPAIPVPGDSCQRQRTR